MANDPKRVANGPVQAIRRDEIRGPDLVLCAAGAIADGGAHTLPVLCEADKLSVEAHVSPVPFRMSLENGLEQVLVADSCRRGADLARVRPRDALPPDLSSGEILHARHICRSLVHGITATNLVLDSKSTIDLHRSRRNPEIGRASCR